MRPRGIVVHSPGIDFLLGILEIEKPVLIEALVSKPVILIRAKENRRLACIRVFHHDGQPVGDFKKSWHKALKEAKLGHVLVHDLRRSVVRGLVKAGVPEKVVIELSGHRTRIVFDR